MQVTDRPSLDAPFLTQAIIVQMNGLQLIDHLHNMAREQGSGHRRREPAAMCVFLIEPFVVLLICFGLAFSDYGCVPRCSNRGRASSPWANSKKTSLNGCSFLSPGRKVCLLILKEEGLKMMNPFVGRKKSCRMLSKRNFFPSVFGRPLSSADTRPGARTGIQAGANIEQLRHAWRSL